MTIDWAKLLTSAFAGVAPILPQIVLILIVVLALVFPMPRRGPSILQKRDPWRRFKGDVRHRVMARAGNRCESAVFLGWGRCSDPATEVDHVYPWSRSGPTTPGNGQALCHGHNVRKRATRPPWWYVMSLERRRRSYFPPDEDVHVHAKVRNAELATHLTWRA